MADQESHDRDGTLTVQEMQDWLTSQIRDSAKAHELRIRGATELVSAYAEGKLTPKQAMDGLVRHDVRWGEALFGTSAFPNLSDQQILEAIDKARNSAMGRHAARTAQRSGQSGEPSL
jgi:hypothetical protein